MVNDDLLTLSLISISFQKWSYWMDVSNLLELCALICAIITIVSREIYHNERFEFSFGIMAVLLAYLTLMSYLQRWGTKTTRPNYNCKILQLFFTYACLKTVSLSSLNGFFWFKITPRQRSLTSSFFVCPLHKAQSCLAIKKLSKGFFSVASILIAAPQQPIFQLLG